MHSILAVDDSASMRKMVSFVLKGAGYEVVDAVDGQDALWFPSPHEVVVTPEGGSPETYPPRLAARTLVVPRDRLTVRIEGDLRLDRAVRIAESLE